MVFSGLADLNGPRLALMNPSIDRTALWPIPKTKFKLNWRRNRQIFTLDSDTELADLKEFPAPSRPIA
jgi:hypothetical protein